MFSAGFQLFAQDSTTIVSRFQKTKQRRQKAEKRQKINAIAKQEEEGNLAFHKQSVLGSVKERTDMAFFMSSEKEKPQRYGICIQ